MPAAEAFRRRAGMAGSPAMVFEIVAAEPRHLPALPAIERAAGRLFEGKVPREVLEEGTSADELQSAMVAGLLWVALVEGTPVGFALAEPLARSLHLEEVDVLPEHGRCGVGRALVAAVRAAAAHRGYDSVTLTTYRAFPWNLPFYELLGFVEIPAGEVPAELAAIVRDEARRGLDPAVRAVLRCAVVPDPPGTAGVPAQKRCRPTRRSRSR